MNKRFFIHLFLFAAFLPLSAANFYRAPQPIAQQEYWNFIQQTRSNLDKVDIQNEIAVQTEIHNISGELLAITQITLNSGETITVDNTAIVDALGTYPPDIERAKALLDALLSAHKEYPEKVFSTADLDSLSSITARPEFDWRTPEPNPITKWIQDKWARLIRWLEKLLGGQQTSGPGNEAKPSLLPVISAIILVVVLFFVFRTLFSDLINEARAGNGEDESQEPLTADSAFEKAQSLSRGGDYRSAVRYLYLSSLLLLDERGLLRYDRSKTNREYLKSIANSPELSEPLAEVIDMFDNVWYGYHTVEEDSFKHYSARVEELKEKKQ